MADEYFHAEVSDVFTATKVYNWSGEHIAYQANNISIPCDAANGHFRALQGRIANKTCLELEPSITWARKTYSAEGRITGYDWEGGFIPVNLQNRLFKLLSSYIESGTCQVEEPKHIDPVESNIESLLFCIVLDRGWQHLAGALERSF